MIEYSAPGKAVVWGEYAVLEGAPAMVMAVDRYACARIEAADTKWHLNAIGFESTADLSVSELRSGSTYPYARESAGITGLLRAVLQALGNPDLPPAARLQTDTRTFHTRDNTGTVQKLGIGSSAAVCTATSAAIAEFLDQPFDESIPLAAHRLLQGKAGSGLDVAAACKGGLIRFQSGRASAAEWPEALSYQYFWVGHAAKTSEHLVRFGDWRATSDTTTLDTLCQASERLFSQPDLEHLAEYAARLKAMDEAAGLGIFSEAHDRLRALANRAQVVYKPCGAGGGDIGIAVSDDPNHLEELIALATHDSFLTLDLEIAAHGVHRSRS
jgi:phosphomevalonate kinase